MRWDIVVGQREFRPRYALCRVEHAEPESRFEEALHGTIDIVVRKQTIPDREWKNAKFRPAAQIRSCLDGERGGLFESEDETVALVEVADRPAIRDDIAFEAPF